ncbi:MAG: polyphosphate kinase 2 family protein [Propionibacteriaceae bacterium]|jgi:PPK2 family polyphosphate:nucleotide phosphotransferase|nr:polyphosphate kinase 2 family protein [Propionibacteriaceae bacterium]
MKKNRKPLSTLLRAPMGAVDVTRIPSDATPGYPGKTKKDALKLTAKAGRQLGPLQECLFANGKENPNAPKLLLVLQGMDTAGKGGVVSHTVGLVDPQGIKLHAFKQPTEEEKQHDFLWRISNALPGPGIIGVFDRSQYEDVLVQRVDSIVPQEVWEKRYDQINEFEAGLVEGGMTIIKCFLHISPDEQKKRLSARLEDPTKYWKFSPNDVEVRAKWPAYMDAYSAALERCNTDAAPWYVIPSDKKWYRNWAVAELLREKLAAMQLSWPSPDYNIEVEKERVKKS